MQNIITGYLNILKSVCQRLNFDRPERIHTKSFVHSWTIQEEDGKRSFEQQRPVQRSISVESIRIALQILN